jgi:hypothetical protein
MNSFYIFLLFSLCKWVGMFYMHFVQPIIFSTKQWSTTYLDMYVMQQKNKNCCVYFKKSFTLLEWIYVLHIKYITFETM